MNISNNNIYEIENLSNCLNLQKLDVSFNNLELTTGLKDLNLREIILNHNMIKSITDDFKTLPKLTILRINRNFIDSIENLSKCEKLRILDISTNRIKSFLEIDNLQELVYLSEIDLCYNPIQEKKY